MNQASMHHVREHSDTILGAIAAGAFLILVGIIFVTTPGLPAAIVDFAKSLQIQRVPIPGVDISLPAPAHPSAHTVLYQAVQNFSYVWGIILVGILVLRYVFRSSVRTKTDNFGDIVFWLGTGYLTGMMLNETTNLQKWFAFWAAILLLIGVSLIVRAIILAGYGLYYHQSPRGT